MINWVLAPLLVIPLIWPFVARTVWSRTITWPETAINIVAGCILTTIVVALGTWSQTQDTQILNGEVVSKSRDRVSCRHSYSCNCRTVCSGSGNNRSCSTTCDTCYEHSYDIDWNVHSNINDTTRINTIDRQGLVEPPRWTSTQKGEPYATTQLYTNYVKAAPDSLFHANPLVLKQFEGKVPAYPINIYDYYRVNRLVQSGVPVKDATAWNTGISTILKQLGPSKQANLVVIVTNQADPNYQYAVQSQWVGAKKNDIVVILGAPKYPELEWVAVLAWTKNNIFQVKLRDDLKAIGKVDAETMLPVIFADSNKYFQRRSMKEFEYLKNEIDPPAWVLWLAFALSILCTAGLTYWTHRKEIA